MRKPGHKSQLHPKHSKLKHRSGSYSGEVRIIGGKWRGRKLAVPDVTGLRPTPNRIRETLFNWLIADIPQSRCLDLFCGSGALGIEAASRGANEVHLVDRDQKVALCMQENLHRLNEPSLCFHEQNVAQFLLSQHQSFDIIFMDPPFHKNLVEETIKTIDEHQMLNELGKVYIETEVESQELNTPDNWQLLKQKNTGQVCYRLYQNLHHQNKNQTHE